MSLSNETLATAIGVDAAEKGRKSRQKRIKRGSKVCRSVPASSQMQLQSGGEGGSARRRPRREKSSYSHSAAITLHSLALWKRKIAPLSRNLPRIFQIWRCSGADGPATTTKQDPPDAEKATSSHGLRGARGLWLCDSQSQGEG